MDMEMERQVVLGLQIGGALTEGAEGGFPSQPPALGMQMRVASVCIVAQAGVRILGRIYTTLILSLRASCLFIVRTVHDGRCCVSFKTAALSLCHLNYRLSLLCAVKAAEFLIPY